VRHSPWWVNPNRSSHSHQGFVLVASTAMFSIVLITPQLPIPSSAATFTGASTCLCPCPGGPPVGHRCYPHGIHFRGVQQLRVQIQGPHSVPPLSPTHCRCRPHTVRCRRPSHPMQSWMSSTQRPHYGGHECTSTQDMRRVLHCCLCRRHIC